ncbi:MAG: SDR family NAD(P)-dependent oxidoreductase [Pseudomonadota bacterium]
MSKAFAEKPLADRIALVTGASRGIGYATALALAGAGAHVVALARTQGGLEELDDEIGAAGGSASLVAQDLKDLDAVDRLGPALYERFGRLDIAVLNAGVLGDLTPLADLQPKVFDETMLVNVAANWRLLRTLDPLVRASDAGRVAFVSSRAAVHFRAYWGAYAMSKAAFEAMAHTYARETEATALRVSVIDPGPTATKMRAAAMPGEDPATIAQPPDIADMILSACLPSFDDHGARIAYREWKTS